MKRLVKSKFFVRQNEVTIAMVFNPRTQLLLVAGPRRWEDIVKSISAAFNSDDEMDWERGRKNHFKLVKRIPTLGFLAGLKELELHFELIPVKCFRRFLG